MWESWDISSRAAVDIAMQYVKCCYAKSRIASGIWYTYFDDDAAQHPR